MGLRTSYISAPLWSHIEPLPLKAKQSSQGLQVSTRSYPCWPLLSRSFPSPFPPSALVPKAFSLLLDHPKLISGAGPLCLLSPLPGTFLLQIFAWLTHSYVAVLAWLATFCPLPCHFLPYHPILFYLWHLISKNNVLIGFLHVIHLPRWNVSSVSIGTFYVLITAVAPRHSTEKALDIHLLKEEMNAHHNSYHLLNTYSVPVTELTRFSQRPSRVVIYLLSQWCRLGCRKVMQRFQCEN